MVNGIILSKFDELRHFIEDIFNIYFNQYFNKYFNKSINSIQNLFEFNNLNKNFQDTSKIKNIHTIDTQHNKGIQALCILKDKRLISSGRDGLIVVYNRAYQPQFHFKHADDRYIIYSLCVLRNGELLSAGDEKIKVWRIDEDDYHLIHTLTGHTEYILKVIELKDGKISSCSTDRTIRVWDNYKCIQTIIAHTKGVISIIEMNNFIISVSFKDSKLKMWSQSTYKCSKIIEGAYCFSNHSLSKLNENTFILGKMTILYLVDIIICKVKQFNLQSIGNILCLCSKRNELIFIGTDEGEILCYDSLSNKIIFKKHFHNDLIHCIIESEDNKLISCSEDKTINIYDFKG